MTKLIHKTGDIFTTTAKGIGHGVNIVGAMGSGIALQFKEHFPDMHAAYKVVCKAKNLPAGSVMQWELPPSSGLFVYNIASQDLPGANARLDWLEQGVATALSLAEENGLGVIALPRIGSGVGGLNQDDVEAILLKLAEQGPVDIELWTYSK